MDCTEMSTGKFLFSKQHRCVFLPGVSQQAIIRVFLTTILSTYPVIVMPISRILSLPDLQKKKVQILKINGCRREWFCGSRYKTSYWYSDWKGVCRMSQTFLFTKFSRFSVTWWMEKSSLNIAEHTGGEASVFPSRPGCGIPWGKLLNPMHNRIFIL